jgi:hypothetical protein
MCTGIKCRVDCENYYGRAKIVKELSVMKITVIVVIYAQHRID